MKRDESNRVILVSDKILIFSLCVGCIYHKGQALSRIHKRLANLIIWYQILSTDYIVLLFL